MSSVGTLNKKITDLANLEKDLWKAFIKAEKEYTPPVFNIIAAYKNVKDFNKQGLLKKRYNFPLYIILTLLFGLMSLFYQWLLIPYILFLFFTFIAREKYVHAYAVNKLRTQNYTQNGFGLDNLSLVTAGVINLKNAAGSKLTKESISSIVKIVKASQERSDVSFGIADMMKKSLYASPIPLIYWALNNQQTLSEITNRMGNVIIKSVAISAVILSIVIGILFFGYDLLIGQTLDKRRKRKYFLLLNIINESFE